MFPHSPIRNPEVLPDELLSECTFYISTLRPLALTRPIITMSDLITQTIYM